MGSLPKLLSKEKVQAGRYQVYEASILFILTFSEDMRIISPRGGVHRVYRYPTAFSYKII